MDDRSGRGDKTPGGTDKPSHHWRQCLHCKKVKASTDPHTRRCRNCCMRPSGFKWCLEDPCVEAEEWDFVTKTAGHKKRKASGSSSSSASTQSHVTTNLVRNQGDFSGALGDAYSQNNTFLLQQRQRAVDQLILSPHGGNPRPAATGGRGEPLPPLRGAREVEPVTHQPARSQSPRKDSRRDEAGQVRKVSLPALKCLEQTRTES
jgi:hypothetical protein